MAVKKIILILIILLFISGCQQISNTNSNLEYLGSKILTKGEIEGLGININTSKNFIYTSKDYYSEYPFVEHAKGFQGSFIRRYYPYEISQFNLLHVEIVVLDSIEHANAYYEDQVGFSQPFYKMSELNDEFLFGNKSIILKREKKGNYESIEPKGYEIYFIKNNYFVDVRTTLDQESTDIPLEKLIEIAKSIEVNL